MLAAGVSEDTTNVDILTGLTRRIDNRREISLDYLFRNRKRVTDLSRDITREHRIRIETKFKTGHVSLRNYIAYNKKTDDEDYFSLFTGLKMESSDLGNIELWSNSRFLNDGSLAYWYVFLKSEQQVNRRVSLTVKLGDRYTRDNEEKHQPYVSFEVKVVL